MDRGCEKSEVIVYDLGEDFGENMDLAIYGMDGKFLLESMTGNVRLILRRL